MENTPCEIGQTTDYIELILQMAANIEYITKNIDRSSIKVYTNKDMLTLLDVKYKTLKKYRDSGELGYSQIGDKFYYTSNDVELFLKRNHKTAFAK